MACNHPNIYVHQIFNGLVFGGIFLPPKRVNLTYLLQNINANFLCQLILGAENITWAQSPLFDNLIPILLMLLVLLVNQGASCRNPAVTPGQELSAGCHLLTVGAVNYLQQLEHKHLSVCQLAASASRWQPEKI